MVTTRNMVAIIIAVASEVDVEDKEAAEAVG
jgi:hypothetical protein